MSQEEDPKGAAAAFAGIIIWCYLLVGILALAMPNLIFWSIVLLLLIPATIWAWNKYKIRYEAKRFVEQIERDLRG